MHIRITKDQNLDGCPIRELADIWTRSILFLQRGAEAIYRIVGRNDLRHPARTDVELVGNGR